MTIVSLLLLASLLPHLTFTARANVGIVNGKEAKPHSRPYMVSVQVMGQHICGGFLISDRFVMTAAHCRRNAQFLTVVLGAHNLQSKNENSVRIKVESYHTHPQYTSESFRNDILLLRLEKHAQINNIKPISIPAKEGDIEADSVCSIAGWGRLETNGKQSNHLMETNVKVMNNKKCESKWGEEEFSASLMMCVYGEGGSCNLEKKLTRNEKVNWISIPVKEEETEVHSVCSIAGWGRLDTNGSLSSRLMETHVKIMNNTKCENKWGQDDYSVSEMMCTYGNGGSCTGDSGGPLVCGKTAVGVTSFGDADLCNSPEHPEVYMKVSAYLPWIHKFVGNVY
ncbi:granzyme B(G,H)-like protein [Labeo rohita]|uniref:trypsin n=1 Tax=Labeo rohita TaxID=84645 RepID=A0A498MRI0_LABRO|nr:granzyme B(G,H)-like protein [Labeo rohita]